MNKPDPKTDPPKPEAGAKPKAEKPTAMRLPPGVGPAGAKGPQSRKTWGGNDSGRPQKDAARRAGKSRKVH
ncbi:MAG: hypothetical protein ACT4PZ_24000 [Panacagrimonas sp.]